MTGGSHLWIFNMSNLTFKYKGKTYQINQSMYDESCPSESAEFQLEQFLYLIEKQDWVTMDNRITGQILTNHLISV